MLRIPINIKSKVEEEESDSASDAISSTFVAMRIFIEEFYRVD